MIWHLLAVLMIGLCSGGLAFLLRKLSRGMLPKWFIPVAAGLGMFGYHAYYDYTWYEFKSGQLPEESIVFNQKSTTSFFKPWSYISPAVNGFTAFDGNVQKREENHQIFVEYFTYEFIKDPNERQVVYINILNCTTQERATIQQGKSPKDAKFEKVDYDDAIYQRVCF